MPGIIAFQFGSSLRGPQTFDDNIFPVRSQELVNFPSETYNSLLALTLKCVIRLDSCRQELFRIVKPISTERDIYDLKSLLSLSNAGGRWETSGSITSQ